MRRLLPALALLLALNLPAAVCQALCWQPVATPPCHEAVEASHAGGHSAPAPMAHHGTAADDEPAHADLCRACDEDREPRLLSKSEGPPAPTMGGFAPAYLADASAPGNASPMAVPRAPPRHLATPFAAANPPLLS